MKASCAALFLIVLLTLASACNPPQAPAANEPDFSTNYMIGTDMMHPVLYFFDLETDQMITVDLTRDPLWPGGMPLHALTTAAGRKAYLSMIGGEHEPTNILSLSIRSIDWNAGTAEVRITNVIETEAAGSRPNMRVPTQTHASQPITDLWRPATHQLHGPSILPNGRFVYFAQWTDDKIRVIDVERDRLADVDPIRHGMLTTQIHGVFFNPSGTRALANPYYFDREDVPVFRVDGQTGALHPYKVIHLRVSDTEHAAWTHFVDWLDDRFAVTATQQIGPTSLTPAGTTMIGPSVWLLDVEEGTAEMIVPPTDRVDGAGIYKPGSDLMVVNGKLYVAEEDSADDEINESYISIFDFSDWRNPRFLKRLRPGHELPDGWDISHEFYRTLDGQWLYAQSWSSAHLVKIDPRTDEVVRTWSRADGFHMPHGNFIPGNLR